MVCAWLVQIKWSPPDGLRKHFHIRKIDYNRFCDPFEILQAKVKRVFSAGPACRIPRILKKQSAARVEPTNVTSMYLTEGC